MDAELLTIVTGNKIVIFYFAEFSRPLHCCYLLMQCEFQCKPNTSRFLPCIYNMSWRVWCILMSCTHAVGTLCSVSSIPYQSNVQQTLVLFLRHRPIDICSLQALLAFLVLGAKSSKAPLPGAVWIQFGWRSAGHKIETTRVVHWLRQGQWWRWRRGFSSPWCSQTLPTK